MKNYISIIIPIKGRSEFTYRILSYLSLIKFPYQIYICDGSINKSDNLKIIKIYKSKLNLNYLTFPYDKNYKYFLRKIYKTLKLVKTKHVMLLPNDDFVNIDLLKIIQKKNIRNQTISGINLDFKINNFFRYYNDFGRIKFYKNIKLQYHKKLNNNNMIERIKYIEKFNPYESIHSKKILSKVLRYSLDFSVSNHKEFMWFFKLIPLYYTKVIFLKKPLLARQVNTYSGEGFSLHLRENFSSNFRLLQFKKFIINKTKNKKLSHLINDKNFAIKPLININRRIIINLVYIKLFLSKFLSHLNFKKNKNNINDYQKIFYLINKRFKINENKKYF